MILNVNTDSVASFSKKLREMHRSVLPSAIRNTLNNAVYDVKTNTMPESVRKTFKERDPRFFKANSKYEKANGWNVDQMKAVVGFVPGTLRGSNNHSVEDLEQQEQGGAIAGKSFIPLDEARQGGSNSGLVKPNSRLSKIKKLIDVKRIHVKNQRSKFAAAMTIAGRGGFVLSNKTVWRVDSLRKTKNRAVYKKTKLYNFKKGRKVQVETTWFMKKASMRSADKMYDDYVKEANRQLSKLHK